MDAFYIALYYSTCEAECTLYNWCTSLHY